MRKTLPVCRALVLFSLLFLSAAVASAKDFKAGIASRPMPEMLSYYELMRLNQKERDIYVQEVIRLMQYMEDRENGRITGADSPSRAAKTADIWSLLLRGENANALSCGTGQTSVNIGGQNHCVQKSCPAGKQNGGIHCSIDFKNEKNSKCARSCIAVASTPGWSKDDPAAIAGPDGVVRGRTTKKTDRHPGAVAGTEKQGSDTAAVTDISAPTNSDRTQETATTGDDKAAGAKPALTPQDACYEIACPATDSQYRFTVKEDFNKRVTEKTDVRCINAGLVGKYSIKGSKKCLPVQKLKVGELDLKCSAGTTMCNPLLFGIEKADPATPHCIPIGVEMTQQCYNKANGSAGAKEFWKNPKVTHETMAEEWDKIVKHLREDLCTEERSAKYHCLECALIAKRIAELNKMVDGCPQANKCGDKVVCASRWKDIKGLENGDTRGGGGGGSGTTTQQ